MRYISYYATLPAMRNMGFKAISPSIDCLKQSFPSTWGVEAIDGQVEIRVAGQRALFDWIEKSRIEPKDVEPLLWRTDRKNRLLVVAPFLSQRTRELIKQNGANFLDSTGNVYIYSDSPPIFIDRSGAEKNPVREKRALAKLKWGTTSRIIREIIQGRHPITIQALAARTATSPAQASRVAQFLEKEALIERDKRGQIMQRDWEAVLRRWADDYRFFDANQVASFLAPRGIKPVLERLLSAKAKYAVTGSQAARALGLPITDQTLSLFIPNVGSWPADLEVYPTEKGANVHLAVAYDSGLFDERWEREGIYFAPHSQIAADLLTGRDRGSSEAEFMIDWMKSHEPDWRR